MKTAMKKICASVLAMLLVLSTGITAMADDTKPQITITNTKQGQTYTAYKMFDVESYSGEKAVYTIKTTDDFYEFVTEGAGANYVTLTKSNTDDDTYYVTANSLDDTTAADFAQLALTYVSEHSNITAAATGTAANDGDEVTLNVSESGLGYYVVNTSLGILAALNTTNPTAEVKEKNGVPNVDKDVLEDSTYPTYGDTNTAQIGDTVTFRTKIAISKNAIKYVLYDKMDDGFTLNEDSIKVYTDESCDTELDSKFYTATVNSGTYKPDSTSEDNVTATFKIEFADGAWDGVTYDNDEGTVYVEYTATLNSSATVSYDNTTPNYNKTYLSYGINATTTAQSSTSTYTYAFDLVKTDGSNTLLDGATFRLKDTNGKEISFVKVKDNEYRVATSSETGTPDLVVENGGPCKIEGLDADKYTLVETGTPEGYNRAEDTTVTITADGTAYTGTVNGNALNATIEGTTYTSGGVQIKNQAGSLLPSTGGIGTTIFYIVGGCVAVAAVIFIITKKRKTAANDAK